MHEYMSFTTSRFISKYPGYICLLFNSKKCSSVKYLYPFSIYLQSPILPNCINLTGPKSTISSFNTQFPSFNSLSKVKSDSVPHLHEFGMLKDMFSSEISANVFFPFFLRRSYISSVSPSSDF